MPDNEEKFGENPFRNLDPAKFPKSGAAAKAASGLKHGKKPIDLEISEEDRVLFSRAMLNLSTPVFKIPRGGFLLGDLCALPMLKSENKKMRNNSPSPEIQPSRLPAEPKARKEDDENEAFLWAMRQAEPLSGRGRRISKRPKTAPASVIREPGMEDFMAGKLEFALSNTDEYLAGHVVGLDELTINRLASGQFSPEAHLDLHGLNSSQAFEALREFMRACWFKSLRVGLVVTGRGRNSPEGHGVLRQKLQSWLTQEPFKRVVLAFCTAQPHDGGAGAIYVLFRKCRKKGRIYWERMPGDAELYNVR